MSMSVRNNNGKSKPLKASSQDYTNLLFTDSDSEGKVPDLRLPPLKGKKQKRRRNVGLPPDDTCGPWNVFKVLFVILIIAGMTALAAVTFWSLKKITEMQDQIEKLQKVDAGTPETITSLQKNLVTLNRSVTELKSTTADMQNQFKDINQKMEDLKNLKSTLDAALDKAKESLELPKTVEILKKSVVDQGSDLQQVKTVITELKDKEKTDVSEPLSNEREQPDFGPFIAKLQDDLTAVNKTLSQEITDLKEQVADQEEVLKAFGKLIPPASTVSNLSTESLNELISETVKRLMKNSTLSNDKLVKDQSDGLVTTDTSELWAKKSDFLLFKEEILMDIKYVNSTLLNFSEEFDAVQKHLLFNHQMITNLSLLVERNSQSEKEAGEASESKKEASEASESEKETAEPSEGEKETAEPSESEKETAEPSESEKEPTEATPTSGPLEMTNNLTSTKSPTEKIDLTEEETEGQNPTDTEKKLTISGINDAAALQEFYEGLLTEEMNGLVPITELAKSLNLTAEELTQYDKDADGNLSEQEVRVAMGFVTEMKKRIKRSDW